MQKIEAYKTSDNKFFESLIDADRHEMILKQKPQIIKFIKSDFCEYKSKAHQTIIEQVLIKWIMWKETQ
jgi:hypothetical protein